MCSLPKHFFFRILRLYLEGFVMQVVREWSCSGLVMLFIPQKKPIEQMFYRLYTSLGG